MANDRAEYEQYLKETGQSTPVAAATTKSPYAKAMEQVDNTDYGAAMANALGAGSTIGNLSPKLAGIAGQFLEGGTMGAAQDRGGWEDKLRSFLTGGATQGGLAAAGKFAGKLGDVGMQIATGRKKYTPGVGTELADQGLVGTRGMMLDQTNAGLTDSAEKMLKAAQSASPINARAIGQDVYNTASRPIATDAMGRPMTLSDRDRPALQQMLDFTDDIKSRGSESAEQALGRRRAAGSSAYSMKSGDPKQSQVAQLSKLEQQKYSQALKDSDPSGELAKADTSYAALKRAQRGLSEEPSLTGLGFASRPVSALGGALPVSAASQAGVKGGRLAEFLAPMARQAAVGGKDSGPSADELAEYQQYLKETGQGK